MSVKIQHRPALWLVFTLLIFAVVSLASAGHTQDGLSKRATSDPFCGPIKLQMDYRRIVLRPDGSASVIRATPVLSDAVCLCSANGAFTATSYSAMSALYSSEPLVTRIADYAKNAITPSQRTAAARQNITDSESLSLIPIAANDT
ncbi:hypothetical protein QFC20_007200 [Naganishia adeliensis]|uniref:Uncharacterized protein n=1 Tax=Naganishia adeliensis TaxID=92952 RepID=A0ACC2V3F0_9TREE|nr:hypothetical protein QFC20_007200 [Naganishia adeliensis]